MNENMNNNPMEVMDNGVKAEGGLDWKSVLAGVIGTLAVEGVIFGVKFGVSAIKNGKNKNVDTEVKVEEVKAEVVEK